MTGFLVYDVFTDQPFGGNPLAIVPDARGIPEARLQRIAREFNFSESVFLYPPEDPAHTARIRIFTPTSEVPFAGHPTIGTLVMLAEAGAGPEMVLELGVGPLAARVEDGRAQFVTEVPLALLAEPDPALVARALGLDPAQIAGPPVMASLGLPFTFTRLADRAALSAASPNTDALREGAARWPAEGVDFAQCAWVEDAGTIHMRVFAPLDGVPEDPATGSAAAALAALLCADRGPVSLTISQGDDMGRPSVIEVAAEPGKVTVAGRAVRMMEGKLVT